MRPCDAVLDLLAEDRAGVLPADLAAHAAACPACREAVERVASLGDLAAVAGTVRAPQALLRRLKEMPRLASACEDALELIGEALDGSLAEGSRAALLDHLHSCPRCNAAWEAFATLREVGRGTRPAGHLRSALAIPPQHRVQLRKRRPLVDLRLATAAAYLLAAVTIVLVGNPATIARASSASMERAGVYARAAVENRMAAYSRRARETIAVGEGWLRRQGLNAWDAGRRLLTRRENPPARGNVEAGGNGGIS